MKREKLRIRILLHFEGQNSELLIINNNDRPPSLAKFSLEDRKQGINKCWPYQLAEFVEVLGHFLCRAPTIKLYFLFSGKFSEYICVSCFRLLQKCSL